MAAKSSRSFESTALFLTIVAKLISATVTAVPPVDNNYKDQFCTDPRTMKKHAAYTEWADAYSCTRHRCQPGGRNLAIYTVGCKRVEAPESAIECEEVVEDTNMQFPYCCTRLRCLVVVRGEVWTRVLGQPWETLPAAPWSHMYKMKKPPPEDAPFAHKAVPEGPVYELVEDIDANRDKTALRTLGKKDTEEPCKDIELRAAPAPDIVIALSTKEEKAKGFKTDNVRHKRKRTNQHSDNQEETEKADSANEEPRTEKSAMWTEIPQNQWAEHDPSNEVETHKPRAEINYSNEADKTPESDKTEKSSNLQALVDAIGSRMKDIEMVVHKMSAKVKRPKIGGEEHTSGERAEDETTSRKRMKNGAVNPKQANPDGEKYNRFTVRGKSKYLHSTVDTTTEVPLYVEDSHLNGYFSDASNSVVRRSGTKDPAPTYMAPVETRRKTIQTESSEARKKRKHSHSKKHKGKSHKKSRKEEKRKSRGNSVEADRVVVSLEDSSGVVN